MTPQEKLRKEFRKWCNTDNLSDPPSETAEIFDWFLARMIPVEVVENLLKEQLAIHSELATEWTGIDLRNGTQHSINPHREKVDILTDLLASLETLQAKK